MRYEHLNFVNDAFMLARIRSRARGDIHYRARTHTHFNVFSVTSFANERKHTALLPHPRHFCIFSARNSVRTHSNRTVRVQFSGSLPEWSRRPEMILRSVLLHPTNLSELKTNSILIRVDPIITYCDLKTRKRSTRCSTCGDRNPETMSRCTKTGFFHSPAATLQTFRRSRREFV